MLPEGLYSNALKAGVEVLEGSSRDMLWDMGVYGYALQGAVDAL